MVSAGKRLNGIANALLYLASGILVCIRGGATAREEDAPSSAPGCVVQIYLPTSMRDTKGHSRGVCIILKTSTTAPSYSMDS